MAGFFSPKQPMFLIVIKVIAVILVLIFIQWQVMDYVSDKYLEINRQKEVSTERMGFVDAVDMPYSKILVQKKAILEMGDSTEATAFLNELKQALSDKTLTNGEFDDLQKSYKIVEESNALRELLEDMPAKKKVIDSKD